jgi:DNA-binding NarL/FixJ family response regulator
VIADDHELLRQVLILTLEQAGIEIVQAVSTGRDAVDATLKHKPDVVLLDVVMPDMDGLAALSTIKYLSPETRVIVISGQTDPLYVSRAIELGAEGYFSKGVSPRELVDSICDILHKKNLRFKPRLIDPPPPSMPEFSFSDEQVSIINEGNLTEQEGLILFFISMGFSNKSITNKLHISQNTVKTHISNIFSKLGVSDRTQAAIWALQHGYGFHMHDEN